MLVFVCLLMIMRSVCLCGSPLVLCCSVLFRPFVFSEFLHLRSARGGRSSVLVLHMEEEEGAFSGSGSGLGLEVVVGRGGFQRVARRF